MIQTFLYSIYMPISIAVIWVMMLWQFFRMARSSKPEFRLGQYVAASMLGTIFTGVLGFALWLWIFAMSLPEPVTHMSFHTIVIVGVRFDEQTKTLVGVMKWDGKDEEFVIKKAGIPDRNNDVYTEECLRNAATSYKPGEPIVIRHEEPKH